MMTKTKTRDLPSHKRQIYRDLRPTYTAESECPDCGAAGPHDDNNGEGTDLTYVCRECGMCFDAYPEREACR